MCIAIGSDNRLRWQPLAAISGEAGLAMNLYYIAGFYLIAFAAFWSLRRIGMQSGVAALGALLYAFLPYHVLRGVPHLTNGAYFLVPLAMSVLVRVARGDFTGNMPGKAASTKLTWLFGSAPKAVAAPLNSLAWLITWA